MIRGKLKKPLKVKPSIQALVQGSNNGLIRTRTENVLKNMRAPSRTVVGMDDVVAKATVEALLPKQIDAA